MIANVALPSFFPHSIATLTGILVIAAIEGWFLMRCLDLKFRESYKLSLLANWKSTIAGIPLAWILWMAGLLPVTWILSAFKLRFHPALESTFLHSAIFGGIMPTEWSRIGFAAAWILMLVPFWFGSVWIERRTILKRLPEHDPERILSLLCNITTTGIQRLTFVKFSHFRYFSVFKGNGGRKNAE